MQTAEDKGKFFFEATCKVIQYIDNMVKGVDDCDTQSFITVACNALVMRIEEAQKNMSKEDSCKMAHNIASFLYLIITKDFDALEKCGAVFATVHKLTKQH